MKKMGYEFDFREVRVLFALLGLVDLSGSDYGAKSVKMWSEKFLRGKDCQLRALWV